MADDCTAPDPGLYPASWSGNANDYSCTDDETSHFNLATFEYECVAVNCAAKYATSDFMFDETCRMCVQCTVDTDGCGSFDIDSTSAGLSNCLDDGSCEVS